MFIQDVFIVLVSLVQIAQINVIVKPNFALNDVRCEFLRINYKDIDVKDNNQLIIVNKKFYNKI